MKNNFIVVIFLLQFISPVYSQNSLNINLLYNWKDSSITPSSLYRNSYNEIWGVAIEGREYAIIGSSRGTHFFDVTNPSSVLMVDFIEGRDTGSSIVHRDYHDYDGYLYMVTDEGNGSLQIVDLSYLPDSVHLVYDQDTSIKLAHNIFIDTAKAKLYTCGGGAARKFSVFSLLDPVSPKLLYQCETDIPWWNSTVGSYGYVHDAFARNDTVYCNAGNGLYIVDFSSSPTLLGSLTNYPDKGYNHSGWLNSSGTIYAMGDETHGKKMKMLDVSNLSSIQFLDTVGINNDKNAIVHNQIIKGDLVYVAYYYNGVYVYNIKNPSNPILTGFYDTSKELNKRSFKGCWGIYPFLPSGVLLASDMQEGLFVLDVSNATSVKKIQEKERFMLFPNPVENDFYLVGLSDFGSSFTLEIRDIKGELIQVENLQNNFLEQTKVTLSSELPAGVYVVNIFNSTFAQSIKLIKK